MCELICQDAKGTSIYFMQYKAHSRKVGAVELRRLNLSVLRLANFLNCDYVIIRM